MKTEIKYRPSTLNDVIYPNSGVKRQIGSIANGQLQANVLLWGPNGTGKTTVAEMLPTAINGGQPPLNIERNFKQILNDKNIEEYIQRKVQWAKTAHGEKLFMVFHEFDNAGKDLYEFWTLLEKYNEDIVFIAPTNILNSIDSAVISRCTEINFPSVKAEMFLPRAMDILKAEVVLYDAQFVLNALHKWESIGDVRRYCQVIDTLIDAYRNPTAETATIAMPQAST
jgi:replication-associated recombination protein RarA